MNGLLQHHRESTEYLMPGHIVKQARKAKRERQRLEKRTDPLAIEQPERTPPPADFRQLIAAASTTAPRPAPLPGEVDLRRAQARMELQRMQGELGKMP